MSKIFGQIYAMHVKMVNSPSGPFRS